MSDESVKVDRVATSLKDKAVDLLADSGPMSQQDLADRLGIDKSVVSRLASELAAEGVLVRERDTTNRRQYRLRFMEPGEANPESARDGAWIAYHHDYSGMNVFGDELACLRFAVEHSMSVKFVEYGGSIR